MASFDKKFLNVDEDICNRKEINNDQNVQKGKKDQKKKENEKIYSNY